MLGVATLWRSKMQSASLECGELDLGREQRATVPAGTAGDQTGGLDEEQIRAIQERLVRLRMLNERRQTILKSIESQGKLTPRESPLPPREKPCRRSAPPDPPGGAQPFRGSGRRDDMVADAPDDVH